MSTATKREIDTKRRDYDAAMVRVRGEPRSPVTAIADPHGDYSLTDFVQEVEILERLGKSWGMKFCQATMGHVRRPGGLWIAYDAKFAPKAVLHVERFSSTFPRDTEINFWSEHIVTGRGTALLYHLPFVVVAEFSDGRYALKFESQPPSRTLIGSRLHKGPVFEDAINMVTYFQTNDFKKISGLSDNMPQTTQ